MRRVNDSRKAKIGAIALLGLVGLLLLLPFVPLQVAAEEASREASKEAAAPEKKVEKGKDVYYKGAGEFGIVSGPPVPQLKYPEDYGTYGNLQSRTLIWIANQQHLYFGSFVLAVPMFVFVMELIGMLQKDKALAKKYDNLAHEFMKISLTAYSITAILGGILIFSFLALYPGFFGYLAKIFKPVMHIYALLFILESGILYIYYYGWDAMNDDNGVMKWSHLAISLLLNTVGLLLMYFANTWTAFMMSPSGVDEQGRFLGDIWKVIHTPLWIPIVIHRVLGNVAFGGSVVAAYAAYRFLAAKDAAQKAHYDWMGYTAMFMAILGLIPLPFAGYWLMREVYAYRQQMGITLMGGLLAWVFIMQATMIAVLFIAVNYYLWQAMGRIAGGERYYRFFKYMLLVLTVSTISWLTPHTLVMTPAELKAMGGAQHPVVGNYGVMSAKNTAVNIMITTTILCFILYQRCNKVPTVKWARAGNTALAAIFIGAAINIIFLGIYGYFIPANVRIGLSVPQVFSTLTTLFVGVTINTLMLKGAKSLGPIRWGTISTRGAYTIFLLAVSFTWTMAVMGYIRSSVRLQWHVNEIMRDSSPWAFTNPIGYAGNINSLNVLIFWTMLLFVFWLGSLSEQKAVVKEGAGVGVGAVTLPVKEGGVGGLGPATLRTRNH
jgi:cytochrome bd-type quinol oxidase subunit 1